MVEPNEEAAQSALPGEEKIEPEEPTSQETSSIEPLNYNLHDANRGVDAYFWPLLGVVGVNMVWWLTSRFILKADFAYISWDTVKENFQTGFVFDDDEFFINQFGHPYQGAYYFNSARAVGLHFWESAPYVLLGSLMWEFFMENESPSINDFVTTSMGGVALGEVMFRLSNHVLDNSAGGGERVWREIVAFIFNPVNSFARLGTGEMWRRGPPPERPPLDGEFSLGGLYVSTDAVEIESAEAWAGSVRLHLEYGDVQQLPPRFEPYRYFTLDMSLGYGGKGVAAASFDIMGVTNGFTFSWAGHDNALFGAVLDMDYYQNYLYEVGETGFGTTIVAAFPLADDLRFMTRFALTAAFGAMSTTEPDNEERDYNFGLGATVDLWLQLEFMAHGRLWLRVSRYWLATVSGTDGHELLGTLTLGATIPVVNWFALGGRFVFADKEGLYRNAPNRADLLLSGEGCASVTF
jgi:hypothetical protein